MEVRCPADVVSFGSVLKEVPHEPTSLASITSIISSVYPGELRIACTVVTTPPSYAMAQSFFLHEGDFRRARGM